MCTAHRTWTLVDIAYVKCTYKVPFRFWQWRNAIPHWSQSKPESVAILVPFWCHSTACSYTDAGIEPARVAVTTDVILRGTENNTIPNSK